MPTDFNTNEKGFPADDADPGDDAIWDLLSLYVDGEATPEQAAQVEAMLRSNPAYAKDLEFLRLTGDTVRTFEEVDAAREVANKIAGPDCGPSARATALRMSNLASDADRMEKVSQARHSALEQIMLRLDPVHPMRSFRWRSC